ncbi:MAG: nucleoside phosphorylase [Clostridiales bacterium]|nr:nucleoside phosphorylase [Clostridiales bacterium]
MEYMPHIRLSDKEAAPFALLPGDPARIDRIALQLNSVKELACNREFRSISGFYKNVPVLAVSTGIGGPSTATAVEELARIGVPYFIRIGSCGALQPDLKTGDLILVTAAMKDDGTSRSYTGNAYPAAADYYLLKACEESARELSIPFHMGFCRSHDSLYAEEKKRMDAICSAQGILGSDMETAAAFVCASLKGLHAASILNVVVEYKDDLTNQINHYIDGEALTARGEKNEILTALNAFVRIYNHSKMKKEHTYEKFI